MEWGQWLPGGRGGGALGEQGHEGMFQARGMLCDLDWGDGMHLSKLTMNVFSCI